MHRLFLQIAERCTTKTIWDQCPLIWVLKRRNHKSHPLASRRSLREEGHSRHASPRCGWPLQTPRSCTHRSNHRACKASNTSRAGSELKTTISPWSNLEEPRPWNGWASKRFLNLTLSRPHNAKNHRTYSSWVKFQELKAGQQMKLRGSTSRAIGRKVAKKWLLHSSQSTTTQRMLSKFRGSLASLTRIICYEGLLTQQRAQTLSELIWMMMIPIKQKMKDLGMPSLVRLRYSMLT